MKIREMHERELINGKPHFGTWLGTTVVLSEALSQENPFSGELYEESMRKIKQSFSRINLERRHEKIVYRPPYPGSCLSQTSTLGIKFLAWGRAFEVMKLLKKNAKRSKVMWINGQRKRRVVKEKV